MKLFAIIGAVMLNLTTAAFAQEAAPEIGGFGSFVPLIFIVIVFWFLVLRPQLKQQKEHSAKVNALGRNDKVILGSGIEGVIVKVDDSNKRLTVKIADNVEIKVVQDGNSIREIINPAAAKAANDAGKSAVKAKKKPAAKKSTKNNTSSLKNKMGKK